MKRKGLLLVFVAILVFSLIFANAQSVSSDNGGNSQGLFDKFKALLGLSGSGGSAGSVYQAPPSYGMEIESVGGDANSMVVQTTGARYVISHNGIKMYSKIDPITNSYNERLLAEIIFSSPIGDLTLSGNSGGEATISTDEADFTFESDSLIFILAKQSFSYTHMNYINDDWVKGSGGDRMWAGPSGGSLHAVFQGSPTILNEDQSSTEIQIEAGEMMGHMVFPPRYYNFDKLYGTDAKPFVQFMSEESEAENFINGGAEVLSGAGFGVLVLFGGFYNTTINYTDDIGLPESPEYLPDLDVMGYEYKNKELIDQVIATAHANNMKVVTYITSPWPDHYVNRWRYPADHPTLGGTIQELSVTEDWMRYFQNEHNLDGWYFDNAWAGSLLDTYTFIKRIREDIGPEGVIYHHNSGDVWGGNSLGLRAIFVDAYVDYMLAGEHGELAFIENPGNDYFRYFSSGYGMSQAFGAHKRMTNGLLAVTEKEKDRVMAEDVNSMERNYDWQWRQFFKPFYDTRRQEYLSGNFDPNVNWPISWYRDVEDPEVKYLSDSVVRLSWKTDIPTYGEVTYVPAGEKWTSDEATTAQSHAEDDPLGEFGKEHVVIISNLDPNTNYHYRIRGTNGEDLENEIIFGGVLRDDFDRDGLDDDWERATFTEFPDGRTPTQYLRDQAVGYWSFDSADANGVVEDLSGHGNNGVLHGAEIVNKALFMNDYHEFMQVPDSDSISVGDGSFSIVAWIKPEGGPGNHVIASKAYGDSEKEFVLEYADYKNRLLFEIESNNNNGISRPTDWAVIDNAWQNVVVTFDSNTNEVKFYRDGVLLQTVSNSITSTSGFLDDDFYVGIIGGTYLTGWETNPDKIRQYFGYIDELMIFDRVLTDQEITEEVKTGINIYSGSDDPDGDGLSNLREQGFGTDPLNPDNDNDGFLDGKDKCPLGFDGVVEDELGEQCEDFSEPIFCAQGSYTGERTCLDSCLWGGCGLSEWCGDGIKQEAAGEQCDDGNYMNGDGCNSDCLIEYCYDSDGGFNPYQKGESFGIGAESGAAVQGEDYCVENSQGMILERSCYVYDGSNWIDWEGNVCGDSPEQCEKKLISSSVYCPSGFCSDGECVTVCGDSITEEPYEKCDDGNFHTESCAYGLHFGDPGCTDLVCGTSCDFVEPQTAWCGDGIVNGPELCDFAEDPLCPTTCGVCLDASEIDAYVASYEFGDYDIQTFSDRLIDYLGNRC